MGMSRRELEGFHRAHHAYVYRLLERKSWKLQEADRHDVAQNVFRSVLTSWPSPQPLNERAYLTTMVVNAVKAHYRKNNRVTADRRLNVSLVAEEPSGPIDIQLVDSVDVADEFSVARLRQRFEAIARALSPADAVVFRRMMVDTDDVPVKEQRRVIAAVRKLMNLPSRPPSIEYPDLVEGPSHCGRTVRRLEADKRCRGHVHYDEELDAAE